MLYANSLRNATKDFYDLRHLPLSTHTKSNSQPSTLEEMIKLTTGHKTAIRIRVALIVVLSILSCDLVQRVGPNISASAMRLEHAQIKRSLDSDSLQPEADDTQDYDLEGSLLTSKDEGDEIETNPTIKSRIREHATSLFNNPKLVNRLLSEMGEYYLTYGRPRYG
ncbi:unnamed protein product [Calicophoron daubneyi]|uniref:Uncharacterized protein n=1 Tax=Calicophoron daubneyi TaxID=300641 RepID=A0AAV2TKH8_CALDB